jgi:hypothetical protein
MRGWERGRVQKPGRGCLFKERTQLAPISFCFFSGAVDDFRLVQTLGPAPLKKMWVLGGRVL